MTAAARRIWTTGSRSSAWERHAAISSAWEGGWSFLLWCMLRYFGATPGSLVSHFFDWGRQAPNRSGKEDHVYSLNMASRPTVKNSHLARGSYPHGLGSSCSRSLRESTKFLSRERPRTYFCLRNGLPLGAARGLGDSRRVACIGCGSKAS